MRPFCTMLALAACGAEGGRNQPPGEDFSYSYAVRITVPFNGATLAPDFDVIYEAGADVASARLDVDGEAYDTHAQVEGGGEMPVELAEGRHTLRLVGLDTEGVEQSDHSLTIRVSDEGVSWVTITSPQDGASVNNPVSFVVDASDDIDEIELFADDWSIGTVQPSEVLSYEFSGTGYARAIEARAWDDGEVVATDEISITVLEGTEPLESDFNDYVLARVATYATDGSHDYYWPSGGDWYGTTQDIWYLDELVAEGDPLGRCYCVGLTWEVYMTAFEEVDLDYGGDGTLNGLTVDDLDEFRTDWFVRDLYGAGNWDALENYGLGERITDWQDVRRGDSVQLWRHSGSGHSVYFWDWETDGEGTIIGLTYWSTQSSTDGIDFNTEYFGASGSYVDPSSTYFGRAWAPEDWIPWH